MIQCLIANYVKNIFVSIIYMIIMGFVFYPLYKIHIIRKISKIKEKTATEEEISDMCAKKGGTSILAAIIIPLILIIILIVSLGMKIFDSTQNTINNQNSNNTSNTNNYYSYNGATIKYGDDWQQEYVGAGGQTYKALCKKDGSIIIVCLQMVDINDGIADYSLSSNRQELYDSLMDTETSTLSANGISISKQTNGFKRLFNDLYYAYYEIYRDNYARSYTILNSKNNTAASLMVTSDSSISNLEEQDINEVLKTIEF